MIVRGVPCVPDNLALLFHKNRIAIVACVSVLQRSMQRSSWTARLSERKARVSLVDRLPLRVNAMHSQRKGGITPIQLWSTISLSCLGEVKALSAVMRHRRFQTGLD